MRGTQAKRIRRVCRKMCNPQIVQMQVKRFKIAPQPVVDSHGKPLIDIASGRPVVIPEREHLTAFWPNGAFRRMARQAKRVFNRDPIQKALLITMGKELAA